MRASVIRLRDKGVRVRSSAGTAAVGELRVEEFAQSVFRRTVKVARLVHCERPLSVPELLPPLFDAVLLKIEKDHLVLAGIESESIDGKVVDYAQTWLARFST
jgi:hypothetical protein